MSPTFVLLSDVIARLCLAPIGGYAAPSFIVLMVARRMPPVGFRLVFDVSRRRALVYAWIGVLTMLGIVGWTFIDFVRTLFRS